MAYEGLMVSVSGVRGRVGEALTPEIVARFAAGFGAWAISRGKSADVVIGRDSRVSGPMFHRAAVAALQSVGARVVDLGLTTTPTCQLAVEHHHAAGGLMLSASHNPIEWNALKFIAPTGLFLSAQEGGEMRAVVDNGPPRATWDKLGVVVEDLEAVDRHIEAILSLSFIDIAGIAAHKYRVVLDCCRGAGTVIMPELLERLGCEVIILNGVPDGRFPRPPEPIAENLGELEKAVRDRKADIGMAVDPDVDRLALVSDAGRAIGEDYTLALAARVVLRHREGPVVTNLSTSRIVDDVAIAAGRTVIRAPVGEVNVATRMRDEKAAIGGEGNGGVILSELHLGRDAPLGAALMLQLLHEDDRALSTIIAEYPSYAIVKDKLDRPNASLDSVYDALRGSFPDAVADTQDGLRLSWDDRWVHVRPSGTEPIVRVIAEARTAEAANRLIQESRIPLDKMH